MTEISDEIIDSIEEVAREFHDYYFTAIHTHPDTIMSTMKSWEDWAEDVHKQSLRATLFYLVDQGLITLHPSGGDEMTHMGDLPVPREPDD